MQASEPFVAILSSPFLYAAGYRLSVVTGRRATASDGSGHDKRCILGAV